MKIISVTVVALFLCARFSPISCSVGDSSRVYTNCWSKLEKENCNNNGMSFKSNAALQLDFWSNLLHWSCREECRYQCMWITVKAFHKAGEDTPKFHGRWPFTRILGMQEPASAFASALNFASNAYMYKKIERLSKTEIAMSKTNAAAFISFWNAFATVCMNAWIWSTLFHMRDTTFTEFMDYACALSMVMGLFITGIGRVFYKRSLLTILCLMVVPMFYFVMHVKYLYTGVVNYDYNMKVNIIFGVLGALIWLMVSVRQWMSGRRYAWRMMAFTVLSGAALMLELFDFPPKFSIWDAHALWHLSTAPLPLLFYGYVIDDIRYVGLKEMEKFAFKMT